MTKFSTGIQIDNLTDAVLDRMDAQEQSRFIPLEPRRAHLTPITDESRRADELSRRAAGRERYLAKQRRSQTAGYAAHMNDLLRDSYIQPKMTVARHGNEDVTGTVLRTFIGQHSGEVCAEVEWSSKLSGFKGTRITKIKAQYLVQVQTKPAIPFGTWIKARSKTTPRGGTGWVLECIFVLELVPEMPDDPQTVEQVIDAAKKYPDIRLVDLLEISEVWDEYIAGGEQG